MGDQTRRVPRLDYGHERTAGLASAFGPASAVRAGVFACSGLIAFCIMPEGSIPDIFAIRVALAFGPPIIALFNLAAFQKPVTGLGWYVAALAFVLAFLFVTAAIEVLGMEFG